MTITQDFSGAKIQGQISTLILLQVYVPGAFGVMWSLTRTHQSRWKFLSLQTDHFPDLGVSCDTELKL